MDSITQAATTPDIAQTANEAAVAFLNKQTEVETPPPPAPTPEPAPPTVPSISMEEHQQWVVKAQYEAAARQLAEQKLAPYEKWEALVADDEELQQSIKAALDRKNGIRRPAQEQAQGQGQPPPEPRENVAHTATNQKFMDDFYGDLLARKVQELKAQDPEFNPRLAALTARQFGMEIKDLDKAWAITKGWMHPEALNRQVPQNYGQPQYGYQPQYAPPPPPQQQFQAAPVVRIPAPTERVSTTVPFQPVAGAPMSHATSAALSAWNNGTLHN